MAVNELKEDAMDVEPSLLQPYDEYMYQCSRLNAVRTCEILLSLSTACTAVIM